jgi:hypothetical protein
MKVAGALTSESGMKQQNYVMENKKDPDAKIFDMRGNGGAKCPPP